MYRVCSVAPCGFHVASEPLLLSLGNPYGPPRLVGPIPTRQDSPKLLGILAQGFLILKPGQGDIPGRETESPACWGTMLSKAG